jgi:gamma-glutamylaminecyclotransferase
MLKIFAVGTLKKGFPLHGEGLSNARFLGEYRTRERFPMLIAGPCYAPMVLDQPGTGRQIRGELYEISETSLPRLDALESVGQPGNTRIVVEVEPLGPGRACRAIVYVKSPELASPIHSGYLEDSRMAASFRPATASRPQIARALPDSRRTVLVQCVDAAIGRTRQPRSSDGGDHPAARVAVIEDLIDGRTGPVANPAVQS